MKKVKESIFLAVKKAYFDCSWLQVRLIFYAYVIQISNREKCFLKPVNIRLWAITSLEEIWISFVNIYLRTSNVFFFNLNKQGIKYPIHPKSWKIEAFRKEIGFYHNARP